MAKKKKQSMADNFIDTQRMTLRYRKEVFLDGSKVYIPIVYGQEFPERAQKTAHLAVQEQQVIMEEIQESMMDKPEEESPEEELHDPILGDVEG